MDFIKVIKTATFRYTSLVGFATIINGVLGFIFFWFLARVFQPDTLGVFMVAVTAASLITDVSTVGTETGVINFVGRFIRTEHEKALRFLKLALEIKIIVSAIVLLLGFVLAPVVASSILGKSQLVLPLRFALFGAVTGLFFAFSTSSLQAIQKFFEWGVVNIFSNAGRLIIVFLLFIFGILTVQSGLIVYIVVPFIAFLFSFLFLPKFLTVRNQTQVFGEFFHYNKWVAIFTLIAAISSRLDTFLITRLMSLGDVGVYSIAVTLTGVVPQLVGAVGTVVAPKLTSFDSREKAIDYLKKLQIFVSGLCVLGILVGIPVGYFFIKGFYGSNYFGSFAPFVILLVAQAVFLFSVPVHMATIYYFSYPKLFVLISIIDLMIILGLGSFLIPSFGYVGAAVTVLAGNISNFIIPFVWVIASFKKK